MSNATSMQVSWILSCVTAISGCACSSARPEWPWHTRHMPLGGSRVLTYKKAQPLCVGSRIDSQVLWSRTMSTREPLRVTDQERTELERLVRQPSTPHGLATRCKVVLLDEAGWTYAAIGEKLDMREQTVFKWRMAQTIPDRPHRRPAQQAPACATSPGRASSRRSPGRRSPRWCG